MYKLNGKFVRSLNGFLDRAYFKSKPLKFTCSRLLYTPGSMGIPQFISNRNLPPKTVEELEKFKQKLSEDLAQPNSSYLFVGDDLKKMIKITNTEEDLDLLKKLIERFVEQHKGIRFQTFSFGPEIMRVYYVLQKPKEALELVESHIYILFKEISSFIILMDLLYENKMYEDVIRMYDLIFEKQLFRVMASPLNTILFASCYKLNTPESYQKTQKVWMYMKEKKLNIFYRTQWFAAVLAFMQNDPVAALELSGNERHAVLYSIHAMALSKVKRYSDVLSMLTKILNSTDKRKYLTQDAIEFIMGEFQEDGGEENRKQLLKILAELSAYNLIDVQTLDEIICSPVDYFKKKDDKSDRIKKPMARQNLAWT